MGAHAPHRRRGAGAQRSHGLRGDDRDGIVSRGEWRCSSASFRQLDRNHDGVLTMRELR
jgi:hypothetical protein